MVKKKMSLAEFLRNNRGINAGSDVPRALLEYLYTTGETM
jgi:Sec7-like guanine-nucleotide exchange factor